MVQINQNFDNINNSYPVNGQVSYRAKDQQPPQVNVPSYYYIPESYQRPSFKEIIKENPIYDMLFKPFIEHPIMLLATWLGLGYGIDKYSHACGGQYEDSLLKKVTNFGDKIQESKFVQNKPMQTIIGWFNKAGNKGSNIVEKSDVLRAMRDTSSLPELSMVKSQMFNNRQEIVQDFVKIAEALKFENSDIPRLKDLGLTKDEKQILYKKFNVTSLSHVAEGEAANYLLLQRLGRSEKEIDKILRTGDKATELTKNEILKDMGLTKDEIKAIREDMFGKYIDKVEEATGKVGNKVRIGGGYYGWMGAATKPFERTIACDEIHNKLFSLSKDGARTATGRFMSKFVQMAHRCLTFGQGKLAALIFIAPILVETIQNVRKADKDQKVGTAVGGLIESTSWIVTWPIALRWMHKFGGIQYAGMSKDKVEEYRKIVNEFNEKTKTTIKVNGEKQPNPNAFKNKAEYDAEKAIVKNKLKELKNVEGQGFFTRCLRKIARFFTMDLEVLKGCNSGNILQNFGSKIGNVFRNIGGVPIRLAVFFTLAMGVLDGTISKIVAKIFGKSYDSMKQDEHKADKKAQKQFLFDDLNQRMYETQAKKQGYDIKSQNGRNIAMHGAPPRSVQNPVPEETIDNYTYIPSSKNIIPHPKHKGSQDTYTYIPSQNNVIQKDNTDQNPNFRKYIPSQEGANIQKTFDNSGLEGALKRADKAEAMALKVLSGNFEGL